MSSTQPRAVLLADYKVPAFLIESVELRLDIFGDSTLVTSQLRVRRNPKSKERKTDLELNGENLEFVGLKINGQTAHSAQYTLSPETLVVHRIAGDEVSLEVQNRIYPQKNTALEGLYQSGDILCTQCESEGFRKITYYQDRPDVMASFRTTLSADKKRFPLLLSNGNRVRSGELPEGRHFVTWEDPHKKPAYLFAAVAGDLELARDTFTTRSGRKVELEVYVDKGQGFKTGHALHSLKNAMKWDEDTFGLEYDLDIYMIVAVESFNFGAMENKGLNIFNSAYVLADPASATDGDFQGVEGVVGHEYFHNWTGNRVTCRDWFQLTLKEGLTVFRDQEFSADMLSRPVKRIEDVKRLKELQFPEDAGPTAHAIRPSSYIEINNFYTATVYEKGAEVIRMIHTLIGEEKFKRGITKYFELYDGQAVTTEDFVHAMEVASGRDLTQFKNWYSRPGTPTLKITTHYDLAKQEYRVRVKQLYPQVGTERLENNVLVVPFKLALFGPEGETLLSERVVELTALEQELVYPDIPQRPIPSWNRSFAAPVNVQYDYAPAELMLLVAHDTDAVSRYEALQRVYLNLLTDWVRLLRRGEELPQSLPAQLSSGLERILKDTQLDAAFKAYLFEVPSDSQLNQLLDEAAIEEGVASVRWLSHLIGETFFDEWQTIYQANLDPRKGDVSAQAAGTRALKNRALTMLVKSQRPEALKTLEDHMARAQTMTEEAAGLSLYAQLGGAQAQRALTSFYQKWKHEPLVMLRWMGVQAAFASPEAVFTQMEQIERDPVFRSKVPNDIRGLYGAFLRQNTLALHRTDGRGYEFIVDRIRQVDTFNPQVASRLCTAFALMPKIDPRRKALMKNALKRLLEGKPSKDVYEMASRFLGQGEA